MKILIVAHIGETLGHLVDGISIARELIRHRCAVEFASLPRGKEVLTASGLECLFHPVSWDWSHNAVDISRLSSDFQRQILRMVEDLMDVIKLSKPDLILSLPGFASTQIARHYRIPHVSILHGVHLTPIYELRNPTATELAILNLSRKVCLGPLNSAFQLLTGEAGLPAMDYETCIKSEKIFIPQPGLSFRKLDNMIATNFIRSTIGPPFDGDQAQLDGACYVTFGSGNPCDITRVICLAREVFPKVIANTGLLDLGPFPNGIITRPFIASSSLAGRVAAVVSHGGVGTVGTFAEWGTPQLIIPTEIAQATMAIDSARAGIAKHIGLESFAERTKLGRQLPDFTDDEFLAAMIKLREQGFSSPRAPSSGAEEIAESIVYNLEKSFPPRKDLENAIQ